ncbi:MAG: hypothetical protein CMM84_19510 [Rhodothermaceae bacterium]|nr:hypothetical protein [Rhodothermaceae bacterium]MBC12412.1 hypothetical protein [Rhodothermaceae bacterium]
MTSDWQEVVLRDVTESITVGHVGPMADEYVESGIPFLRSLNILPYRLNLGEVKYISPSFHERLRKSSLQPGDVVVVRTGKPGTATVIPEHLEVANCSDLVIIRPGDGIDARYLAYYFNSSAGQSHVDARSVGSVQKHFNIGDARRMKLRVPPPLVQERIADILGSLDDKIEANRAMNRTLEAMAQALYREWFVDFGPFQDEAFGDSELGRVPEGWEVGPFSRLATLHTKTIQPKEAPSTEWEHYSIPAYDAGERPAVDRGVTIKSGKYRVPPSAVLASKLNPRFPRVWLPDVQNPDVAICSTEFMPFVPVRAEWRSFLYSMIWSDPIQESIQMHASGTTPSRQRVRPTVIAKLPVLIPPADAIDRFSRQAAPLQKQRLANLRESVTLAETRDYLLPKLLSGEIEVGTQTGAAGAL